MVKALGGVFLYSENPRVLAEWYSVHLGITYEYSEEHSAYYVSFPYKEVDSERRSYTVFSILHNRSRPFVDGKIFTLNLRVSGIQELTDRLLTARIEVRGPERHDEGIFAWLVDPEGNYIELWEDPA